MKIQIPLPVLASFFATLGLASYTSASLLTYESFSDTAATPLAGTTADIGLGPWTLAGGVAGSATYTSPGLTYPNLATSGNKVSLSTGTALFANLSTAYVVPANSVQEIWGSFIMSTPNNAGDAALSIFQVANPTTSTGAMASIGMINTTDARLISGRNMSGGGNAALATSAVPATQENFYLFRLTIDTNPTMGESAAFWINPTISPGMTVASLGAANGAWTVGNTGLSGIAAIGLYTTGSNSAVFDEIRLGTTLSSVVIPEPSTYAAIIGLGVLGLALLRRRRR